MKNLDDMLLFAEVVQLKSFRAVAERRGIASSVVSKHISRLEQHLGVQLLIRTTRKLKLTAAGEEFFQHCQLLESGVTQAEQAVAQHAEQPKGVLRLAAPTISGQFFLPGVIDQYLKLYPQMHVEMTIQDDFQDLIASGFDLAIRTGTLSDSTLRARQLVNSRWHAYAAPEYLATHGVPSDVSVLKEHNCLQFSHQEKGANDWPVTVKGKAESIKISGRFQASSLVSLREAAVAGMGIAFMPVFLTRDQVAQGQLVPVLQESICRDVGIYAIYPDVRYVPRKISEFINILAKAYNTHTNIFH
ncbi:LysR family transcriptional regulator [Pseudomaricurvus alkylphenolicus]|uniref:LysR family transcriptional regulator n=1 Tax=Pseudomaricurvus alkylphenolicus TaxID=1306991 RepID=UPI00141E03CB|nr:LysR family transcriptional regulator [Pseudomaricurvus alkylphenolicus]NIB45190.1 LysR family transcriptional regulator [Pseudomaricurvus alkylphenolicus]